MTDTDYHPITVGEPLLLTPAAAARLLGKSRNWAYGAIRARAFPTAADPIAPIQVGCSMRISRKALEAWIERQS